MLTNPYLLVFIGGGVGSVLRYAAGRGMAALLPAGFPWGTLTVNAVGGLAAGFAAGLLLGRNGDASSPAALFVMTGVLGGFTTFSAFAVDSVLLVQRGQAGLAALYVMTSVILAIAGVSIGMAVARLA